MESSITHALNSSLETLGALSHVQRLGLLLFVCWVASNWLQQHQRKRVTGAPVHGYKSIFEPKYFLQARYNINARNIIASGYKKWKDHPFVVSRNDDDVTLLPMRYLNEVRLLPESKMSARLAIVKSLVPEWTGMAFLMESSLHFRVVQNKLTPELYKYVDMAKAELDYAWPLDVPQPDDWVEVNIQNIVRILVARMSNAVFVGHPLCRDPAWLQISIDFAIDTFAIAFLLRLFPAWTHPVVARLLPFRYRQRRQLRTARAVIGPLMEKHRAAVQKRRENEDAGAAEVQGEGDEEEEDTLLHWMIDHATEKENSIQEMADRNCVLTLASIHTTTQGIANLLVDLCDHPEWIPVLREEIDDITQAIGRPGETTEGSSSNLRQWFSRLEKMDSFLTESQRMHPPVLVNPTRLAVQPHTFKDGTHVPAGAKIGFPSFEHQHDPAVVTPDPALFDPMRSYRKRHAAPEERNKHLAGQPHPDNLVFGYGTQACPGRHFAVAETKLILVRLLSEYDVRHVEGKSRPRTFYAGDNAFLSPGATLMMRKRK